MRPDQHPCGCQRCAVGRARRPFPWHQPPLLRSGDRVAAGGGLDAYLLISPRHHGERGPDVGTLLADPDGDTDRLLLVFDRPHPDDKALDCDDVCRWTGWADAHAVTRIGVATPEQMTDARVRLAQFQAENALAERAALARRWGDHTGVAEVDTLVAGGVPVDKAIERAKPWCDGDER